VGRRARKPTPVFFDEILIVDAVDAERAFLHDTLHVSFARAVGQAQEQSLQPIAGSGLTRRWPSSGACRRHLSAHVTQAGSAAMQARAWKVDDALSLRPSCFTS